MQTIEASEQARERAETIVLTLSRTMSVEHGCRTLGIGRTRFQELRNRMLAAAVTALEEQPGGRPRVPIDPMCKQLTSVRHKIAGLEYELKKTQVELDLARTPGLLRLHARKIQKGNRR
jgi:hypothetical protein